MAKSSRDEALARRDNETGGCRACPEFFSKRPERRRLRWRPRVTEPLSIDWRMGSRTSQVFGRP